MDNASRLSSMKNEKKAPDKIAVHTHKLGIILSGTNLDLSKLPF